MNKNKSKKIITREEVREANIKYHTKMATYYNKHQPHYNSENVERVEKIIKDLAKKTGGGSIIDIGCGTGFILKIARKYFNRVVGIDIREPFFKNEWILFIKSNILNTNPARKLKH